jgi:hypothetical protein
MTKAQTVKFMQERVISIDDKDRQVWALITDVPKVKTPWQYVCFILNVIIPGKSLLLGSTLANSNFIPFISFGLFLTYLGFDILIFLQVWEQ